MRTIMLLVVFVSGLLCANAQQTTPTYTVSGTMYDKAKTPIEYASVSLWKESGESVPQLIAGTMSDETGNFVVSGIESGTYQLKISYIGFDPHTQQVEIDSSVNLKPIYLEGSNTLSEITVTAHRPIIKSENGILSLDVANTDLKNLPTIMDVLAFAPSVEVIGNTVSVLGRVGNPLIFINNKEVKSMSEVELLQPSDILSVSVDRNPSAKYDASVRSVIRIKTKKKEADTWSAQVYHSTRINSRYNHYEGVDLNVGMGKFDSYLMYKFSGLRNKEEVESYQDVNYKDIKQLSTSAGKMIDANKDHSLTIGTTYNINESNKLDIQYHADIQKQDADVWSNEVVKNGHSENLDVHRFGKATNDDHDVNLNYTLDIDSISRFTLYANYINKESKMKQNINTTDLNVNSLAQDHLYSKTNFDIYVAKAEYNRLFGDKYDFTVGARYSGIRNKGRSLLQSIDGQNVKIDDNSRLSDNVYAGYLTLARQFGNLYAEAGLRAEYDKSDYKMNGERMFDKNNFNVFPSLTFNYQANPDLSLSLDMAGKITRVPFDDLDPTLNYITSVVWQQGNPNTLPHKEYYVEVGAQIKRNWTASVSYTHHKDLMGHSFVVNDDYPGLLFYTPVNIDKASSLKLNAGYINSWGWYMVKANGIFVYNRNKVPSLAGNITMDKPMFTGVLSNTFNVKNKARLMLNFAYRNKYEYIDTKSDPIYILNAAVNFKLIKNHLDVTVFGNDLLKKSYPKSTSEYGYIRSGEFAKPDSRMVGITLKYSFNGFRDKSKSNNQSAEERSRIGQ
ncbi:TonB-dependent receptor [Dysgonomonas sp. OttesenSCG-928-M03]|nr:TonB-dependent receptor [Dysgonomonas sp. OttesenSCG-928-M03]